jgi:hypothetical protein
MTDYVTQALILRRDQLQGKLNARDGQAGFAANVEEIRTAITALDAEIQTRREAEQPAQTEGQSDGQGQGGPV